MKKVVLIAGLLLFLTVSLKAQYWSEYVLEKGFQSRDYFLQPHRILSLQTKSLDASLLGIRPDSLSEISFQPARLSQIKGTKLYVDLKGSEDKIILKPGYIYPIYAYQNAYFLPPYMPRYAERQLQPLLSVIYLGDILENFLPGFKYGFSYELIHHQGTYYEYIPIWYYGGYDAFGVRAEASNAFPELPVNIKQDGLDEKTETAHFMDAFLSLQLATFFSVGVKVGRTQTDINGDYLRVNNNEDSYNQYPYRSNYLNQRSQGAKLRQNEFSGGVIFKPTANREIGFFGGMVAGNHSQSLLEMDSSFYSYGNSGSEEYYSLSLYQHENQSSWLHDGNTRFAGVHGNLPMQHNVSFRFLFEYLKTKADLTNSDAARDTSYNYYRWRYYEDDQVYDYIYSSLFRDSRFGTGDESQDKKTGAIGLVVPIYNNSRFTIGLYGEITKSSLTIYEDTDVMRFRNQETETPYQKPEKVMQIEDKTLLFEKETTNSRLALPAAVDFFLGKGISLRLAAVKKIWKIAMDEVVDVWYRTDSTTTVTPAGTTIETRPQRIDRYRATPTRRSDSTTDFSLGMSFQPSRVIRFDVAMGTEWTELRNWQFAILLNL